MAIGKNLNNNLHDNPENLFIYKLKGGDMCGIYIITNLINGKVYIGQSKNITNRLARHRRGGDRCLLHRAIKKYGVDNFKFEVLEECQEEDLNEREIYYIAQYNSVVPNGYNISYGGNSHKHASGEKNSQSKMTTKMVYDIREDYLHGLLKSQSYVKYKDIISINTFADIWNGKTWRDIHMDVYTKETKYMHIHQNHNPHTHSSVLTEEDIQFIRDCKNQGMGKQQVIRKFYPLINYNTFSDAWCEKTFKNIRSDIPKKEATKEDMYEFRSGVYNHLAIFTEEMVRDILTRKMNGESIRMVHRDYPQIKRHCFSDLWYGRTYKQLYKQICNDYPR